MFAAYGKVSVQVMFVAYSKVRFQVMFTVSD